MTELRRVALADGVSSSCRKGQCDADHEHEAGLNHIPRASTDPESVGGMELQNLPEGGLGKGLRDFW